MRVALHFQCEPYGGYYGPPIEEIVFRALLDRVPVERRHVRIRRGDLLLHFYDAKTYDEVADRARRLLTDAEGKVWTTLDLDVFAEVARGSNIYVLDLSGLPLVDARTMDERVRELDARDGYLGALQVDSSVDLHWVFYDQGLPEAFRIAGQELRLLHGPGDPGDTQDTGMRQHWEDLGLFSSVGFEDVGLRGTIFDPFDTRDHAQRIAELADRLSTQFAVVVDETVMRIGDLDPRLANMLHAAFNAFDEVQTNEQLAQAALSCRRFLEQLAHALYLSRGAEASRDVPPNKYRQRLSTYIGEKLEGNGKGLLLASLEDVDKRIKKLDSLANKGVHGPQILMTEVQRLLVGLTTLTYDVLTLAPPPTEPFNEPYEEHFLQAVKKMIPPPEE
jgi:hypothetical protein